MRSLFISLLLVLPSALAQPNIVMIVADDMGVDMVRAYQEGASPPCTPNIDGIAERGLLFRNAWSNPSCSPTRAQILTGLHAHHSGMGANVLEGGVTGGLVIPDETLPRGLAALGYETVALGKWHVADQAQGLFHPNQVGFDYYAGSMGNLSATLDPNGSYTDWIKNTQGVEAQESRYATRDTTRDAINQLEEMQAPFFLYVAYNAPHVPLHWPDARYCNRGTCSIYYCNEQLGTLPGKTKAMVEALDDQIGRLLTAVSARDPNAIVIFFGDNGTASTGVEFPFDSQRAKTTLYEAGINVPLIIKGPGIAAGETAALVSAVDFDATLLELAGGMSLSPDSVSFAPVLLNPEATVRETVYAEAFRGNFDPADEGVPLHRFRRAVRNERFKLIRRLTNAVTTIELYDLRADRFEDENLFPPQTPLHQDHFDALTRTLVELGVAPAGDLNSDGFINLADLARVLSGFGQIEPRFSDGDANFDGVINLADLMLILDAFGTRG